MKGHQELIPPKEPPKEIPKVNPQEVAVNPEDFSGLGKAGGSSKGVENGEQQSTAKREEPANEGVYDVNTVEEKPKLTNQDEVVRQLSRQYPPLLRDAGVTGQAIMKFVVGTDGRVEPGSVTVVSATNDQFGDAAKRVVEKMKFRTAKVNGKAVRVQVQQPIAFNVAR